MQLKDYFKHQNKQFQPKHTWSKLIPSKYSLYETFNLERTLGDLRCAHWWLYKFSSLSNNSIRVWLWPETDQKEQNLWQKKCSFGASQGVGLLQTGYKWSCPNFTACPNFTGSPLLTWSVLNFCQTLWRRYFVSLHLKTSMQMACGMISAEIMHRVRQATRSQNRNINTDWGVFLFYALILMHRPAKTISTMTEN